MKKLLITSLDTALLMPLTASATLILGDLHGGLTDEGQYAGNDLNQSIMQDNYGVDLIQTVNAPLDLDTLLFEMSYDEISGLYTVSPGIGFDLADWSALYLVNKADGSFAVWDLASIWDGAEDIEMGIYANDFAPPTFPEISHLSIYGTRNLNSVNDVSTTIALLGIGIVGIFGVRKTTK